MKRLPKIGLITVLITVMMGVMGVIVPMLFSDFIGITASWIPLRGRLIGMKGEAWAASSSKLGIFLLASYDGGSNGGEKIIGACPKIVTFYDPQNSSERLQLLRDYKTKCPGGISVIRIHDAIEGKQVDFTKNAEKTADEFSTLILGEVNRIGNPTLVNYVSGTNEFENYDDEELVFQAKTEKWQWLGRFWMRLAQNISQAGYKPNIGDLNVGHPTDLSVFNVLFPALREIKRLGGAFSYHGYTIDYSMNGTNSTEGEKSLRYRMFYEYFRKMGASDLLDLPLLITETGVAEGGDRLKGFMPDSIEKFKQWLEWYDGELQKDGFVVGATIFQSGDTGQWASFNTDHIAEWLCTKLGGTDCKVGVAPYKGSESSKVDKCAKKPSKVEELKQFLSNLFKKNVTDLKRINKGDLPPLNIDSGGAKKDDDCIDEAADTVLEGAQQYNVAASRNQPPAETSQINWWQSAWDNVRDAFSFGNKKAEEYLNASLPPNIGTEILVSEGQPLASQGETLQGQGVLGIFGSKDKVMEKALSVKYCAGLPAGLCGEDNMPLGTKKDTVSPSPEVGEVGQYPEIVPPPGCGQADSSTEGYTGNECVLVQTGWCSVSCLKRFTDGNIDVAAKLSQICLLESGGDPDVSNKLCLVRKTYDFSIGLFQINLIAHCRHEFTRVSWEERSCEIDPSYIVGTDPENGEPITQCEERYKNPIENINKAYGLSNGGTNWTPWQTASGRCGFIDPIDPGPR